MGGERRLAGCSYSRLVLVLDAHTGSWRHLAIAGGQMLPVLKKTKTTSYHNTGCLAWRWLSDTNKWFKWVFLLESHNYENSTCLLPMTASLGGGGVSERALQYKIWALNHKVLHTVTFKQWFSKWGPRGRPQKIGQCCKCMAWKSLGIPFLCHEKVHLVSVAAHCHKLLSLKKINLCCQSYSQFMLFWRMRAMQCFM